MKGPEIFWMSTDCSVFCLISWLRVHIVKGLIGLWGVIISGHADLKQTNKQKRENIKE